jgi:cytochrome P450
MPSPDVDVPVFPISFPDPLSIPPEYARLRAQHPVSRVRLEDGAEAWLVTGYRQAREVLGSRRFSSDASRPGFPRVPLAGPARREVPFGRALIRMDPPEHTRYRRMLNPDFVIQRVEAMRPQIQAIADGLLDDMVGSTPPVDLVTAFALPLPSLVICELLGVPRSERSEFERFSRALVTEVATPDERLESLEQFRTYMEGLAARKQSEPGDDLLSRMLEWEAAGELEHEEVVDTGRLLLLAGHVTTANMIGLGVIMLLRHPAQLDQLREDPTLVPAAVEELLRHQTLIQGGLRRVAVEDVEVGGQTIRAGEGVIVLIAAANRDPAVGGGEDFDIHHGARNHLAFGYGFHQCIGQLLARIELQVALVALARRFPTLALATPPEDVAFRSDGFLHGVRELPVTW